MSGYNDNIGDIDEPDDAWSNLPASFGLELERQDRQTQELANVLLAQQSNNPKDSQCDSEESESESSESIDESKLANMLADEIRLPDEMREAFLKSIFEDDGVAKLQEEIKAKEELIKKLPNFKSYDDKGQWIPRSKRPGLFFRLEQVKEYYGKCDELQQICEKSRIDSLVREHEKLHPPNTEECPICLESIPMTSNQSVQYLVCCGNFCCFKCIQSSVAGGTMKMTECPLCRADLLIESKESIRLTEQCANKGRAWAQSQMGIYYLEGSSCEHGSDVPYKVNKEKALRLFQLAADQRDPDAIRNIAQLHYGLHGVVKGLKKSLVKARTLMKESADLGNLAAQRNYAMMCRLGEGGPQDKTEAAHYYSLMYSQKDSVSVKFNYDPGTMPTSIVEAAYYLGVYYYYGNGDFSKNLSRALFYLEEAARKGERCRSLYMYIAACLMERYEHNYGRVDFMIPGYSPIPRVFALYRKSAELGETHSKEVQAQLEAHMKKMCANCGKEANTISVGLKACVRCRSTWYCGKWCQTEHWKAGHKSDCVKYGSTGVSAKK